MSMEQTFLSVLTLLLLNIIFNFGHAQDAELTHEPSSTLFFQGESLNFTCIITEGYASNWHYKFLRNGQEISKSNASNFLQLNLTADLRGNYQCTGYHKDTPSFTKRSNNITLFVSGSRPTATVTADRKIISQGETAKLTCSVQDSAGWKYDWFIRRYYEAQIESNSVKNSISIYEGGIYWCWGRRGSPDFFTEPSEMFYIEKVLSNQATVLLQHNWTKIYRGDMISFKCEISGGNPELEYEWRTTYNMPLTESTIHMKASTSSNGYFWCRGREDSFSSTEWSQAYYLSISDEPRPTMRSRKRRIPVGGTVTLNCSLDDPTEWKYRWFRHTGNFSEVQIIEEGKSENFISISQGGVYSCQGTRGNPAFFTEESHGITIEKRVSYKAVVSVEPSWSLIYPGETVTITCTISGGENNEWTYEWRKPIFDTLHTNEHRIVNASESSSGIYRCLGKRKEDLYSSTEWSDITTVTVSALTPKAHINPDRDFSRGGSVTLTCSVAPLSSSWNYYWYRDGTTFQPVELNSLSNREIIVSENGSYYCRGGRGRPAYYSEYSHWVKVNITDTKRPTVTQEPTWPEIYMGEKITLTCEIQREHTDWVFEWMRTSGDERWTQNEKKITLEFSFNGEYFWCRGRRKSSPYTVTFWSVPFEGKLVGWEPFTVLTVSPSWLILGASVTLSCEVKLPSAGWRFYWYKAVPNLSYGYVRARRRRRSFSNSVAYDFEPLPDSINGTAQNFYVIHGQKRTAAYACRAGRGNPEYVTYHSEPRFVWSEDSHPAASLTVSPDREQHFTSESVTLNCRGNSTGWRLQTSGRQYIPLTLSWQEDNGFTTIISTSWPSNGVYWCEYESREFSNAVNITIHDDDLVLLSPVHPVSEGASVTLGCNLRRGNFTSPVTFYKEDKPIQKTVRGELNIPAVSASDEGFYKCGHLGEMSPQSWMAIKASSSSLPVSLIVGLIVGFLLAVLVALLFATLRNRLNKCHRANQTPASPHTHNQDGNHRQIYSSLLHADAAIYESIRGPENPDSVEEIKVDDKLQNHIQPKQKGKHGDESVYTNMNSDFADP